MALMVQCPFCKGVLPFRRDKRGGRYFRCGQCQTAFFFSGKSVIDQLESGGSWSLRIEKGDIDEGDAQKSKKEPVKSIFDDLFNLGGGNHGTK